MNRRTGKHTPDNSPAHTDCAIDGATLDPTGYCPTGDGYPALVWFWATGGTAPPYPQWARVKATCRFACPLCTANLDWDGGCLRCRGSRTPGDRTTWTYPGHRYDYHSSGHWRVAVKGPQETISNEEFSAIMRRVTRAVGGMRMPEMREPGGAAP